MATDPAIAAAIERIERLKVQSFSKEDAEKSVQVTKTIINQIQPGPGLIKRIESPHSMPEAPEGPEATEAPLADAMDLDEPEGEDGEEEDHDGNGSADGERAGDYESDLVGRHDHVRCGLSRSYHLNEYFGPKWDEKIIKLDEVDPMTPRSDWAFVPHPHQLKAAAQAHYNCTQTEFRGIMIGDEMGVGKTHEAIMMMDMAREEPGAFSAVVCPKSVVYQWADEIECAYKPGKAPRVLVLDDPRMTASQLLAAQYDIVIVSYGYVEHRHRSVLETRENAAKCKKKQLPKVERPVCCLHSELWRTLQLPIKRLVIDEAQNIKNPHSRRYQAVKALYYRACILLSGTFAHNKWSDVAAPLSFLSGHMFSEPREFKRIFMGVSQANEVVEPEEWRLRFLQKLLLATTVARPSKILKLKRRTQKDVYFKQSLEEQESIEKFMRAFHDAVAKERKKRDQAGQRDRPLDDNQDDLHALVYAIRAQQASMHLMMVAAEADEGSDEGMALDPNTALRRGLDRDAMKSVQPTAEETEAVIGRIADINRHHVGERRQNWLERLQAAGDGLFASTRLECILGLYEWLRKTYRNEKIIIFSRFLQFLDILAVALKSRHNVESLRYDGTIRATARVTAQRAFTQGDPSVPLLITGDAGGTGLNITAASIVIQCEIWWNRNSELQAYCRAHRQGQQHVVKVYRLMGDDSIIDSFMLNAQGTKTDVISRLMKPILRPHDVPVTIPDALEGRSEAIPSALMNLYEPGKFDAPDDEDEEEEEGDEEDVEDSEMADGVGGSLDDTAKDEES